MAAAPRKATAKKKGKVALFEPHLVIDPAKLTWIRKIGEGGCGEVHQVEHHEWGMLAIKKLGVTLIDERLYIFN